MPACDGRAPNGQSQNLSPLQGVMICNIYFRCCADEHSARSSASINWIEIALVGMRKLNPCNVFASGLEELQIPRQDKSITCAYRVGHRCAPGSYRLRGANCTIFRRLVFDLSIE